MRTDERVLRHRPREAHESTTRRLTSRGKGYHPSQFPKSHPASVEKVRRTVPIIEAPRLQATFPPGSAFSHPGPYGSFAHDDQYCYPWLNALWPAHSVLMTSALRVESPAVGAPVFFFFACFGRSSIALRVPREGSDPRKRTRRPRSGSSISARRGMNNTLSLSDVAETLVGLDGIFVLISSISSN